MTLLTRLTKLEKQHHTNTPHYYEAYSLEALDAKEYIISYTHDGKSENFAVGEKLWTDPPIPENTHRVIVRFTFKLKG